MKKILGVLLIVITSFLLVSCDDLLKSNKYEVSFYDEIGKIDVLKYKEGEIISLSDIPYDTSKEFSHLTMLDTNDVYPLGGKIYSDLDLFINYKDEDINLPDDPLEIDDTLGIKYFDIFYLNDTHGAIMSKGDELGLSKIGNYIKKSSDQKSVFITGGDIFQGQLISNHNKGALMVEIFNEIGLDAFVIGNHEFDWGLDVIAKYFDNSDSPVKANFPLLGANVIDKRTNKRPDYIKSHTIVNKHGFKIGIVGVIGDGLESSISTLRVKDYQFTDSFTAVSNTVNLIKDQVDFILVGNHGGNTGWNERVSTLPKVKAIFNGHSHSEYTSDANGIPYIQSRHNGHMVGKISLTFDKKLNSFDFINGQARNVRSNTYLNGEDLNINNIINKYYPEVEALYNNTVLISSSYYSQNDLANYISKVMMETTNSVAGFQNTGGTRATFSNNQAIKGADVFQVFPFDNQIIVVEIKGSNLKKMLNDSYFFSSYKIDYSSIIDNNLYKIATNDYIYYNSFNEHIFGSTYGNEVLFGDMYEIMLEVMINSKNSGKTHFDVSDPIIFNR